MYKRSGVQTPLAPDYSLFSPKKSIPWFSLNAHLNLLEDILLIWLFVIILLWELILLTYRTWLLELHKWMVVFLLYLLQMDQCLRLKNIFCLLARWIDKLLLLVLLSVLIFDNSYICSLPGIIYVSFSIYFQFKYFLSFLLCRSVCHHLCASWIRLTLLMILNYWNL